MREKLHDESFWVVFKQSRQKNKHSNLTANSFGSPSWYEEGGYTATNTTAADQNELGSGRYHHEESESTCLNSPR